MYWGEDASLRVACGYQPVRTGTALLPRTPPHLRISFLFLTFSQTWRRPALWMCLAIASIIPYLSNFPPSVQQTGFPYQGQQAKTSSWEINGEGGLRWKWVPACILPNACLPQSALDRSLCSFIQLFHHYLNRHLPITYQNAVSKMIIFLNLKMTSLLSFSLPLKADACPLF